MAGLQDCRIAGWAAPFCNPAILPFCNPAIPVIWEEMAAVGTIARAHGIRGQVIVNAESDFLRDRFRPGAVLFIQRNGRVEPMTITTARFHQERPVIGLAGVGDMNAASALAGAELRVPLAELAALPEGSYYRHDLVGCRVETPEGATIGTVAAVEGTIGGSRLVLETAEGEVLVPLVAQFCPTIDVARKRIVAVLPDGLLELNRGGRQ
jgi:16S rRNA processing protein RimM